MDRITPASGVNIYKLNMDGADRTQRSETGSQVAAGSGVKIVPEGDRLGVLKDTYGDKTLKQMGLVECATCSSRTYVDGSDDPGVSFKTPAKISPEASFALVSAHEQEHVVNERSDAVSEGREVVAQSVQIFMSICPECGKSYASGGVTRTTTASKGGYNQGPTSGGTSGALVDAKV